MTIKLVKANLLASTMLVGMAGGVSVTAAATAQDADEREQIIVTGSRIPRQDLSGPSPVAIFDEASIDQSGVVSIGRLLRELPSVAGAGQTTAINNGGDGTEQISIRGLGAERTLVLINGRRVPDSSAGLSGQVDLNTIPVSLIERVEVLKDGASVTYGSDAVAGVVNVILRDDFEGFEFTYQGGVSGEGDGDRHDYSLTFGEVFDGGNFLLNLSRTEQDEIVAGDRDWSATAFGILFGEVIPLGSSAPPWGNYFVTGAGASSVTLGPDFSGGSFSGFRDFSSATDTYNFAPVNYQTQPTERFSATAIGNLDIEALSGVGPFVNTRMFAEVSYIDRESQQLLAEVPLAPFAFFGFDAPYSAANAYNPFGQDITDWRRRLVETGGRSGPNQTSTLRIVAGLEGELQGGWEWAFTYLYGDVDQSTSFGPIINLERTALAVGPTAVDGSGTLRCDTNGDGSFTSADDQLCVPLDVFGENSITPEMIDYIGLTQNEQTSATSEVFSFDLVNPELFQLPAGPMGVALGYVHREERGSFTPDSLVADLALRSAATGTPALPTDGGYTLDELFLEVRVPVLANQPLAHALDLEGGVRYSDYDTFGDTTNWAIGLLYRPVEDLLLRARFNTAFRAPQINDLFGGQSFSFPSVTDPCASSPTAACIADGVPAGGFTQISSQVRTIVGGNSTLQPEEADIYTFGFVATPSFLEGVAFGADYWNYELTDPITTVGAGVILSQCAATGDFCNLITRITTPGATQGAPILIDDRTTNVGRIETSGVDFFAEWQGIEAGQFILGFKLDGTYTDTYDLTQANGLVLQHAGYFRDDNEGHFAEWRLGAAATAEIGPFLGSISWRWIDEVTEFGDDLVGSCVDVAGNEVTPGVNRGLTCVTASNPESVNNLGAFQRTMDGAQYFDLYTQYEFGLWERVQGQVFFGIDNIFDEDPPFSVDGFNDNTDVRTFDTVGRYFYGGIRTQF